MINRRSGIITPQLYAAVETLEALVVVTTGLVFPISFSAHDVEV